MYLSPDPRLLFGLFHKAGNGMPAFPQTPDAASSLPLRRLAESAPTLRSIQAERIEAQQSPLKLRITDVNNLMPLRRAFHKTGKEIMLLFATAELEGLTFQHRPDNFVVDASDPNKPRVHMIDTTLVPIDSVEPSERDTWTRELFATFSDIAQAASVHGSQQLLLSAAKSAATTFGATLADVAIGPDRATATEGATAYASGFLDRMVHAIGEFENNDIGKWWNANRAIDLRQQRFELPDGTVEDVTLGDPRLICDKQNMLSGDMCSDCPLIGKDGQIERIDNHLKTAIDERREGIEETRAFIIRFAGTNLLNEVLSAGMSSGYSEFGDRDIAQTPRVA